MSRLYLAAKYTNEMEVERKKSSNVHNQAILHGHYHISIFNEESGFQCKEYKKASKSIKET